MGREFLDSPFWLYWRTMFAFEEWHSALEFKLYLHRFIHHIGGLPDFTALKFTKYNQYESFVLPLMHYLTEHGVVFRSGTEVLDVDFAHRNGEIRATAIRCRRDGTEETIELGKHERAMPVGLQPILAVRLHSLANFGSRPHAFRGIRPCRFLILGSFDGLSERTVA